jgi:hypothetical protein
MQTIDKSSTTISGRATRLLPAPVDESLLVPKCPGELPVDLADKDCRRYEGFYHTDHSVPSDYFLDNVERPPTIQARQLDFTYLFDDRLDNPDYINMGEGRRVAEQKPDDTAEQLDEPSRLEQALKRYRAKGQPVFDEPTS